MNIEKQKTDPGKYVFFVVTVISFIAIYLYNSFTPYMSDDLLFDTSLYHSFLDVFKQEYWQYHNWNGRSVLQIILKIFMLVPKPVFDFCNSICYVATMILIYKNLKRKKSYDVWLYLLIHLCMWMFCVEFSQTILWVAGACNYLWGRVVLWNISLPLRLFA